MILIHVIDHGTGNLASISNFLDNAKVNHQLASNPKDLKNSSHIIIPGVGHFQAAMQRLRDNQMDQAIIDTVTMGVPILGICLGMQILYEFSEEGMSQGLGLMKGKVVKKIPVNTDQFKVPNVGWHNVDCISSSPLFNNLEADELEFYFANSFAVENINYKNTTSTYHFDIDYIASAEKDNIYCTQFHPEKSGRAGHVLMSNFLNIAKDK